jgi:hypothetical protein
VLVVAALVQTGGQDRPTREQYQNHVITARDRVSDALAFTSQSTTPGQVLSRLTNTSRVTASAADDLDELGAPEGLDEEAGQLVAGLRYWSGELEATVAGLRDLPQTKRVLRHLEGLNFVGYTRTQKALRRLRAKGIEVPLLTGY